MRYRAVLLGCVVSMLIIAPAQAAPSTDEIAASFKDSPVYVGEGVEGTTSETAPRLASQLNDGDNIVIVMLPEEQIDPLALAKQIDSATNHQRIVSVSVGDDLAAVSSLMPSGVAGDLMSRARSVSTSVVETHQTFIRNVHLWQVQHPQAKASKPSNKDDSSIPIWAYGVAMFLIICALLYGVLRKKRYRTTEGALKFQSSPSEVRELLRFILELRPQIHDGELRELLDRACSDTEQYFRRSSDRHSRGDDVQTFVNHLKSVRNVLKQYIDVQNYPRFYDHPDTLMRQGHDAVAGFATFVEQSIRRGRRSDLTEFRVNTDILSAQRYS